MHRKSGSVACSALCILAPLHSTTKYGPCVCSFRTGGFVSSCRTTQDQGLLFYFTTGWFKHNPPPKKVLCAMSTSFLRVRPCKLDEDILNVQNFTVVTLKNSVDIWTFVRLSAKITAWHRNYFVFVHIRFRALNLTSSWSYAATSSNCCAKLCTNMP